MDKLSIDQAVDFLFNIEEEWEEEYGPRTQHILIREKRFGLKLATYGYRLYDYIVTEGKYFISQDISNRCYHNHDLDHVLDDLIGYIEQYCKDVRFVFQYSINNNTKSLAKHFDFRELDLGSVEFEDNLVALKEYLRDSFIEFSKEVRQVEK